MDKLKLKAKKVVDNKGSIPLAVLDTLLEMQDSIKELKKEVQDDKIIEELNIEGSTIKGEKGDKGEQGIQGERGLTGPKGEQGIKGKDGSNGKDGTDGRDGLDGLNGENGKDGINGSPDEPKDIKLKLESLKGDERLDAFAIKNLPKFTQQIIHEGAHSGAYETPIKDATTGTLFPKDSSGAWLITQSIGSSLQLQTNSVDNLSQTLLNLINGYNTIVTNTIGGNVQVDAYSGVGYSRLDSTQVAFGDATNIMTSSSNFVYDVGNKLFMASNADSGILDVYFGSGITSPTPLTYTIHGTGATGKDKNAANWIAAAGISTGAGIPAAFKIQTTTTTGSSGDSTPQTLFDIHEWREFQSWSKLGQRVNVTDVSADYTVLLSDFSIGITGETSGVNVTLPLASSCPKGTLFEVKDVDGKATTYILSVKISGSDTIDIGFTTGFVLTNKYQSVLLISDGVSNWRIRTN